jgi:cytochrome c-type biogenesis protein CcmF
MVVEVTPADGRSYLLKPKMWVNEKSDQLVANPDIKVALTRDLYLAPAEYTPPEAPSDGGLVVLRRGEKQPFRDLTLTLEGWQMAGAHDGSGMSVVFQVAVERTGGERTVVAPSIVSGADGELEKVAVAIPGAAGGQLRVLAMDVGSAQVQAELTGFGGAVGHSAVLHRNETFTYNDLSITFSDFDMSVFDPDAGVIEFGVMLNVVRGERRDLVVPWFRGGAGNPAVVPAEVPDSGGLTLSIGRVDAEAGAVEVRVFDPALTAAPAQPASLVVDISTKPLILLVWLGTILVVLGTGVAISLRLREIPNLRGEPARVLVEGGGELPVAARAAR